ncbi:MAG: DUF2227 family putative metal-binding protein [Oligoflexia bacterium]|nr:DUF2227 family putative metal-binding protein [Oligoflexia bacterium]
MPKTKTHIKINITLAMPLGVAILFFATKSNITIISIFLLSLLYNTFVLNPDLDLARYIKPLSLRGFLYFPFIPYSWLFRHRGLSHSLILGTITRVIYILLLIFFGLYLWNVFNYASIGIREISSIYLKHLLWFIKSNKDLLLTVFASFFYGDLWHIVLDKYNTN